MKLSGKFCIVTGASSGIGKATALKFAEEGASGIVLVSRTQSKLEETKTEIKTKFPSCSQIEIVVGDCAIESTNAEMVKKCLEFGGGGQQRIDAVFVNAGSTKKKRLVDLEEADINQQIDSNYKSVVWALKYCLKNMDGGSIIVNTSVMGTTARAAFGGSSLYSASKAAANMLVKYAAIEAADLKKEKSGSREGAAATRVNAIAPGVVGTNIVGLTEDQMNDKAKTIQLSGRCGRSEEIASFVTFLASDEASFITGSIQLIDGGWSLKA